MAIIKQLALALAILATGAMGGITFNCDPSKAPGEGPGNCQSTSVYQCSYLCPAGYNCGTDAASCWNTADGFTCYCNGHA
ncbi:hypothetical protein EJ03DRAFT_325876 [Teratosphaeria nubilosa]|uniref:Uncharacterized protein n=1 Tax=Teratosphaeria nubilosa TaxID=161662 RepID=A0A6G1LET0_9PEZI|nr:hypothetical protein EJ03DRAFT_325876 [Teratosphaeria nubilosa]